MKTISGSQTWPRVLNWCGALGHTFVVIEPDTGHHSTDGYRSVSESSYAHHAAPELKGHPERELWQRRKNRSWRKVDTSLPVTSHAIKRGCSYASPFRVWWEIIDGEVSGKPVVIGSGDTIKQAREDARKNMSAAANIP